MYNSSVNHAKLALLFRVSETGGIFLVFLWLKSGASGFAGGLCTIRKSDRHSSAAHFNTSCFCPENFVSLPTLRGRPRRSAPYLVPSGRLLRAGMRRPADKKHYLHSQKALTGVRNALTRAESAPAGRRKALLAFPYEMRVQDRSANFSSASSGSSKDSRCSIPPSLRRRGAS